MYDRSAKQVGLQMSSERRRWLGLRPRNSSSLAWSLSLVGLRGRRASGPKVSLTGDSGACQTVVSQVSHSYPETLVMPHWNMGTEICISNRLRQKMNNVSIRQAISAPEAHYSHARAACDNSVMPYIRISACIAITCGIRSVANNNTG